MIHQVCHVTRNVESNSLMRILVRHNNGARAHAKTKEGAQAHYAPSPTAASRRPPRRWRAPLSAAGACAAQYASMPCSGLEPVFVRVHLGVLAGLGLGMPACHSEPSSLLPLATLDSSGVGMVDPDPGSHQPPRPELTIVISPPSPSCT